MDLKNKRYALHASIGYQATLTSRVFERRLEDGLRALGLSRVGWCILLAAGEERLTSPSDIAAFIGIDRTATSRALKGLEAEGLLTRVTSRDDRRRTQVALTDAGQSLLTRAIDIGQANAAYFHDKLSADEQELLRVLMAKCGRARIRRCVISKGVDMAKYVGQVQIALPPDRVFALYTNARLTAQNASTRTLVDFTHVVENGPGTQAVWTFLHPEMKTEMVETVIEAAPPHRIASHLQITRVMPLQPHEVTPGVMPMLAYDMRDDYSPLYGKLPVEGVMQCDFTAQDGGTFLNVVTELKVGGLSRLLSWASKLAKKHPVQTELEDFRDWVEKMDDQI